MTKLEKAWREQEPTCMSCGWCPCFYEVGTFEETKLGEYRADCVGEAEDAPSHRGYYVYPDKEETELREAIKVNTLDQWESEFKNIENQISMFAGDDHPLKQFFFFGCKRGLALIDLVRKKDEQLILASNYAYHSGARGLAISTSDALALTEQLK